MHINHIVLSLDAGGLERIVIDVAREQLRSGHSANILCLERPGKLAADAETAGAGVFCVQKRAGLALGIPGHIRRFLIENSPDVVHTHQIGALFYAGPAAKQAHIPVIVHTEHGKHYESRRRTRWLARWSSRYASRFFCVSQDIADAVIVRRIASRKKVSVMPNGIEASRFARRTDTAATRQALGIPAGAAVVGTVGRLVPVKCQDVLLRGFACLPPVESVPPHLVLVGGGECDAALRRLAADLGVADRVHFAGYQSEPERFLQIMDVFALTSSSEGMPLAVLEAWAAGVPVVGSRIGGLSGLLEEGRTGLLFDVGNHMQLGAALHDLLTNHGLRERLSAAGRQCVAARYDVSVMAKRYQEHYDELLHRGRRGVVRECLDAHAAQPSRLSV